MKWHIKNIILITLFQFVIKYTFAISNSKPFYVIGHMANKISDVRSFLKLGANGIETDVHFTSEGEPILNYHGFPCDCWRYCFWKERFQNYLNYIRIAKTPGSRFYEHRLVLLYFDLKVKSLSLNSLKRAGELLASDFIIHLFDREVEIPWIIIGIPDIRQIELVKSFQETLRWSGFDRMLERIGYDVYLSDQEPNTILWALYTFNITHHIWLGEGITNCLAPDYNRLRNLVQLRDFGAYIGGHVIRPNAVYHWTIDSTKNIRLSLAADVNGIVTNSPDTVRLVLREPQFANRYWLALMEDVPWKPITNLPNLIGFWHS